MKTSVPFVVVGLVGGYAVAAYTGVRPLGGAVLLAAGLFTGLLWVRRLGWLPAIGLGLGYLAAFVVSHVLAPHIGAWPSVAVVTAAAAGATLLVERNHARSATTT